MNNHFVSIIRRCELSYVRGEMEKYGLIPLEGRLIRILKDKNCSQEEMAEYLNLDKGRIARNLASLEEKGLICRKVNENDRRQKFVSLTEKGEEIYKHIRDIYKSWDQICYAGFSEEEQQVHQDHIKRIAENAVTYRKRGGI